MSPSSKDTESKDGQNLENTRVIEFSLKPVEQLVDEDWEIIREDEETKEI